jgi:hypothetical protein
MKKLSVLGLVLISTAAWAASPNANQNACFGQARATFAVLTGDVGFYASMRKGDNASINAASRDSCQGG